MVLKIILAISLVGFLGFEVYNLVAAIKRKRAEKLKQKAEQSQAAEDIQKSDKEDNA